MTSPPADARKSAQPSGSASVRPRPSRPGLRPRRPRRSSCSASSSSVQPSSTPSRSSSSCSTRPGPAEHHGGAGGLGHRQVGARAGTPRPPRHRAPSAVTGYDLGPGPARGAARDAGSATAQTSSPALASSRARAASATARSVVGQYGGSWRAGSRRSARWPGGSRAPRRRPRSVADRINRPEPWASRSAACVAETVMKPLPPASATAWERADDERVVRPGEGQPVDDHELAGRSGHVDALPEGQRAEQAGRARPGRTPAPVSGSGPRPAAAPGCRGVRASASAAYCAARIELNSPSVRPPAARTSASSSSSCGSPEAVASRAAAGGGRRRGWPAGVVERAADVEPGPRRRVRSGQAERARHRLEAAAELERRRRQDDRAIREQPLPQQPGDRDRRGVQDRPASRARRPARSRRGRRRRAAAR